MHCSVPIRRQRMPAACPHSSRHPSLSHCRVRSNKGCLKLGYGLVHDLRAIAAALGGEGGSCIAGARALLQGWAWANTLAGSVQGALCAACCEGKRRNFYEGPGLGLLCDFRTHAVYRPVCDGYSAHRPCRPAAVVEPACDVGCVHRFLRHQGLPGMHKVRSCTRVKLRREAVLLCFRSRRWAPPACSPLLCTPA